MRKLNYRRSYGHSVGQGDSEIIQRVLPSGLIVILAPRKGTSIITEVFAVRAGWKYETLKTHGVSHFLEHMMFKGTERRPQTIDITKEIDGTGGESNAFTSSEMTCYYISAHAEHVELIHDLISDMVLNSSFGDDQIEHERSVIIEELRMYKDDISGWLGSILWPKLLYGDQPAGRVCIGTEKRIKALRRKHLIDYMQKLYVASNSVVCLAGCIPDPDEAFKDIEKFFAAISQDPPRLAKPPVVENQIKPAFLLRCRPTEQSNILLGVRTYGLAHPDCPVLAVMATLLGGYMSSRMYLEVRDKRALAYEVGTGAESQTDTGFLVTYAGLKRECTIDGLRVMLDQYRAVAAGEVTEEELERAKSHLIGLREMELEESCNVAIDLVKQFALTGRVMTFGERAQKIKAVTLADIQRVAQDIFVDEKFNLAIVGPHRGLEKKISKILSF